MRCDFVSCTKDVVNFPKTVGKNHGINHVHTDSFIHTVPFRRIRQCYHSCIVWLITPQIAS